MTETATGQQNETVAKNLMSNTWNDMRIEIDFSDDSDVLFTAKAYLNNEYVSRVEVPKIIVAKSGSSWYWSEIISPASFPLEVADDTNIKDMYMYNGIENKSIIPETFSDSFAINGTALVDEDFSNATASDDLDVATKNTTAS